MRPNASWTENKTMLFVYVYSISQIFRLIHLPDVLCTFLKSSQVTQLYINKDTTTTWEQLIVVHTPPFIPYLKLETASAMWTYTCIERSVEHCVCGPYSLALTCCPQTSLHHLWEHTFSVHYYKMQGTQCIMNTDFAARCTCKTFELHFKFPC